ncbi:MAG: ATP-binding protein [Erysipelotrichales bacterium]|nr:ATP-binding protein [Erysipelotrichales bacterium]
MGKIIGKVIEVKGLSVKARLSELLPPYLISNCKYENAPKINGFLKTKVGLDNIVCQVIGEISEEKNGVVNSHLLELQVKGHLDNGKFIQGLRMLPIVSASVELLDKEDYASIYIDGAENTLEIGYDLFDQNKEIKVNLDNIIPSHIGIFGNTGSGKSNTLVKILHEYEKILDLKKTNRGKFIVFDINNEYSADSICPGVNKKIYHLKTRSNNGDRIPLNVRALTEDNFIVLTNASEKTQVPVIKNAYKKAFGNSDSEIPKEFYLDKVKSILKNSKRQLFFSLRTSLKSYFTGIDLDNFKYHSKQGEFYYSDGSQSYYSNQEFFDYYLNKIDVSLPEYNTLDRFIFELCFAVSQEYDNGVQLDFMTPVISRTNRLINDFKKVFDFSITSNDRNIVFDKKNVCIIQLGNVNKDMKETIPSLVASHIFDSLANEKDKRGEIIQIVNIVVDEAHNILYEEYGQTSAHKNVLDVFEKIVKEGRKFGCFLTVSSQRPSDISQTIISQLHNYFIHKLVNPTDLNKIEKAVAYLDKQSLDFLTVMAPGECIVSGTAFQMPNFLYVNQVDKKYRPNSENVKLSGDNGLFSKQRILEDQDFVHEVKPVFNEEIEEVILNQMNGEHI